MGAEELLGGRYRLEHVAGHGGMATVFSAHDTVLDRKVAIKLLQRRSDSTGVLRTSGSIAGRGPRRRSSHPNVVSVHDVGETDDGRPYIVMDYVEGSRSAELIARRRRSRPNASPRSGWGSRARSRRRTRWESSTATSSRPT